MNGDPLFPAVSQTEGYQQFQQEETRQRRKDSLLPLLSPVQVFFLSSPGANPTLIQGQNLDLQTPLFQSVFRFSGPL